MAWIEIHQSLWTHRKTLRASKLLGVPRPCIVGHLVGLWLWAMDNADADGSLGDMSPGEIAAVAEWDGDGERFVDALVRSQFLNLSRGVFSIHNWLYYTGKLLDRKEKNRQRVAKHRTRRNAHVTGLPTSPTYLPTNQPTNLLALAPQERKEHDPSHAEHVKRLAALRARLGFNPDELAKLAAAFPNFNQRFREYLEYVDGDPQRVPKDADRALRGFLAKGKSRERD